MIVLKGWTVMDIFRGELNISNRIRTSNLQLWFWQSMNKVQCSLARADPSPGLAKCLNSFGFVGMVLVRFSWFLVNNNNNWITN